MNDPEKRGHTISSDQGNKKPGGGIPTYPHGASSNIGIISGINTMTGHGFSTGYDNPLLKNARPHDPLKALEYDIEVEKVKT
jgi:hypothetical protein